MSLKSQIKSSLVAMSLSENNHGGGGGGGGKKKIKKMRGGKSGLMMQFSKNLGRPLKKPILVVF